MTRTIIALLTVWPLQACAVTAPSPRSLPQQMLATELIERGTLALLAGDLSDAEALYEQSLELELSAEGFDGLGCVALAQKNIVRAENYFRRVVDNYPEYAMAHANLASIEEQYGRLQVAQQLYETALRLQPDNVVARNNYAAFLAKHKLASAGEIRKQLQKAAALTENVEVQRNLKIVSGE
jgi:Tfp pilus assembly protein PilF